MNGILLVDKPVGMTSHDVVRLVKRLVRPRRVGHSGTLDPFASGLIVVAVGSATRAIEFLDEAKKTYLMTVRLGEESDTDDGEGHVIRATDASNITLDLIEKVLANYLGVIRQIPPHFSAIKKNGVPLYKLARKGVFPELQPRTVEVFSLDVISWSSPLLSLCMVCSRGTYARSVARDIGRDLGVGGRIESLRRTASGAFQVEHSITVDEIAAHGEKILAPMFINLKDALAHIPTLHVSPEEISRLARGNSVLKARGELCFRDAEQTCARRLFKALTPRDDYLIIAETIEHQEYIVIKPHKVLDIAG